MNKIAILFGLLLVALGLYGYLGQASSTKPVPVAAADGGAALRETSTAKASPTALIPAAFGVLLLICGLIGLNPKSRKNALHAAAGIAVLGVILGGGRFLSKVGPLLSGDPAINQRAVIFTGVLGLICLVYVVLSVQSFIAARRSRTAKTT